MTGQSCSSWADAPASHGDGIARGYVTVDTVNKLSRCASPVTPATSVQAARGRRPIRTCSGGTTFYVNSGQNFASGNTLVQASRRARQRYRSFNTYPAPAARRRRLPGSTRSRPAT